MPFYAYRCPHCGIEGDYEFRIGCAPRVLSCDCGEFAEHVIGAGVQIAPSALETKGADARAGNEREGRWNRDMPAYARMRAKGMQPKQIDGSARLEDQVGDQLDIDHKNLLDTGVSRERIIEGTEQAKEIMAEGVPL